MEDTEQRWQQCLGTGAVMRFQQQLWAQQGTEMQPLHGQEAGSSRSSKEPTFTTFTGIHKATKSDASRGTAGTVQPGLPQQEQDCFALCLMRHGHTKEEHLYLGFGHRRLWYWPWQVQMRSQLFAGPLGKCD